VLTLIFRFAIFFIAVQRWVRDVVSNGKRAEKDWLLWHVLSNRFIDSLASKYPGVHVRQVSKLWVDWFLEVYMTIMADLEHLGLGPFECVKPHTEWCSFGAIRVHDMNRERPI
jgi:hypothetical protein